MRQLIYPVKWEIDEDWPESGNKYKYNCIDKATLDLIANQKEVYLIMWWDNRRYTNFYDVVKGTFYRGEYGVVNFSGEMVKASKNYKKFMRARNNYNSVWCNDDWMPAVGWGEFHECFGIELTEDNKLTALVFDNEQEALDALDKWYGFLEKKSEETTKEFFASEDTKKDFKERLISIQNVINNIDETQIAEYWNFIDKLYWNNKEFRK